MDWASDLTSSRKQRLVRASALVLALLTALLLLELGLRLVGALQQQPGAAGRDAGSRGLTVLCLGDSFTLGVGATPQHSYPRQLQRILRRETGRAVTVINNGVAGRNSSQVRANLAANLRIHRPDLVLLLTGATNQWNLVGYAQYRHGDTLWSRFKDRLRDLRVVKLAVLSFKGEAEKGAPVRENALHRSISLLKQNLKKNPKDHKALTDLGQALFENGEHNKALKWLLKSVAVNPKNQRNYPVLGQAYLELGQYEQALRWYQRGLRLNPGSSTGHGGVGWVHYEQGRYSEAKKWFIAGIAADGANPESYFSLARYHLSLFQNRRAIAVYQKGLSLHRGPPRSDVCNEIGSAHEAMKQWQPAMQWYKKALVADPVGTKSYVDLGRVASMVRPRIQLDQLVAELQQHPAVAAERIDQLRAEYASRGTTSWAAADMARMVRLCQDAGVPLLLQTYPLAKPVNPAIKRTAGELRVPLVDHQAAFDRRRGEKKQLFAGDGHCTAKGYGVMAGNVYRAMVRVGVLK